MGKDLEAVVLLAHEQGHFKDRTKQYAEEALHQQMLAQDAQHEYEVLNTQAKGVIEQKLAFQKQVHEQGLDSTDTAIREIRALARRRLLSAATIREDKVKLQAAETKIKKDEARVQEKMKELKADQKTTKLDVPAPEARTTKLWPHIHHRHRPHIHHRHHRHHWHHRHHRHHLHIDLAKVAKDAKDAAARAAKAAADAAKRVADEAKRIKDAAVALAKKK